MFVIKIKTLKFYAHTFLSYNDKAGGKGSNIIGRCYLVSTTTFINRFPIFVIDIANHPNDDCIMFKLFTAMGAFINYIRGPNFDPPPPPPPPQVDNYRLFKYVIFVHVTKRRLSSEHLPTSSIQSSY